MNVKTIAHNETHLIFSSEYYPATMPAYSDDINIFTGKPHETKPYKKLQEFPTLRIYSDGRIYDERLGRFRNQTKNGQGYIYVRGYNAEGICKRVPAHRLIARAWIPNPENLSDVDHINHDRADNRIENLRWLSHQMNCMNRRKRKTKSQDCNLCPEAKLFKKYMLLQLRLAFKHDMIFLKSIHKEDRTL